MKSNKNSGNAIAFLLVIIVGIIVFGVKTWKNNSGQNAGLTITDAEGDWRHHKLIYTKHARCRMDCREISEEEVEYILTAGTVNEAKSKEASDEATGNCDSYALEGKTNDGQHVRIVYGACDKITKVITAIDLDEDHKCNCR